MKITKLSFLKLGFVMQFENPAGFIFIHPKFSNVQYVFKHKTQIINILETAITFNSFDHFIEAHEAITQSKVAEKSINWDDRRQKFMVSATPLAEANSFLIKKMDGCDQ